MQYRICVGCEHYYSNNNDKLKIGGCRAFPNETPKEGAIGFPDVGLPHSHDKPIREVFVAGLKISDNFQDNNYVYTPVKRKFDVNNKEIPIFQDKNEFADENGRYNGK